MHLFYILLLLAIAVDAFPIVAKTTSNIRYRIDVEATDSIETVKGKLQDRIGYPPEQQKLSYKGEALEDGHTLSDYNIIDPVILNLQV
ncbi:unnamed protein product, partial [Mesorhabditis belari]|uniref:Ubiquitin-like domain-containing protein n=1 Tax=Mesorhabditis belari TaxID=2138241 RepID=A0AAF3F5U0_9BILA